MKRDNSKTEAPQGSRTSQTVSFDADSIQVHKYLTPLDRQRSFSAHATQAILDVLSILRNKGYRCRRAIDLGCGYGGLACLVRDYLCVEEMHGVDLDRKAAEVAQERGIKAAVVDIEKGRLPYEDGYFDLVMSLGVFDYFKYWDDVLREINRIVRPDGYLLVSLPNLASYHNRLALLFGYQPRDIEVSKEDIFGVLPFYKKRGDTTVGHIHTVTLRAFIELTDYFGFEPVRIGKINTITSKVPRWFRVVNSLLDWIIPASLSKRFVYLGRKVREPRRRSTRSWWQEVLDNS